MRLNALRLGDENYITCDVSRWDLKHDPKVPPEGGIKRTVEWMKRVYIRYKVYIDKRYKRAWKKLQKGKSRGGYR